MKYLNNIITKLGWTTNSKYDYNYKDLAPIDDIPTDNTYLEALDWTINNNRIKNIALSGPYGAGKSSIIRSYLKNHSKLKYVNVSLGSFLARKPQDKENAIPKTDEIQQAILQQLFYKVKYETIPQSRYRKLHKIDSRVQTLILATIIIAAFVYIPNLLIFFISPIDNAVMYWHLPCETTYWVISLIIILISILAVNIYRNHFGKIDIKEVKLPVNTTLVTNQGNEQSVFNRNAQLKK